MTQSTDNEREIRRSQSLSLVIRTTFVTCFIAGIVLAITLSTLKLNGVEDVVQRDRQHSVDASWASIIFKVFAVGIVLPSLLSANFWFVTRPGSKRWFELLGALMLFVVVPTMLVVALVRFLMN